MPGDTYLTPGYAFCFSSSWAAHTTQTCNRLSLHVFS